LKLKKRKNKILKIKRIKKNKIESLSLKR